MRRQWLCLLGVLLATTPPAADAQGRLGRVVVDSLPGGTLRVLSSGPTEWGGTSGWRLELERTIQPREGSPGSFGDPFLVALLSDGRLLVVDQKPMTILLYDAAGTFVRALGREGSGPGEYRAPQPAAFLDSLFVHDHQLRRGTVYGLDGNVARTFATACCIRFGPVSVDAEGRFRVMGPGASGRAQWLRFSAEGALTDSFPVWDLATPKTWALPRARVHVPLSPENRAIPLRSGDLVHGATDQYRFLVTRAGRDTVRIFGRTDLTPERVPARIRDSLFTERTGRDAALRAIASRNDIPAVYPLWQELAEDGAGNIWVLAGGDGGRPPRLDVFDATGRLLGSVPSPVRSLARTSWTATHMAALDLGQHDTPLVRIYRIRRAGR